MATRRVKDAKDLETDELIYFKGHAKSTYIITSEVNILRTYFEDNIIIGSTIRFTTGDDFCLESAENMMFLNGGYPTHTAYELSLAGDSQLYTLAVLIPF